MSQFTPSRDSEEIREIKREFVNRIYDYTVPEMTKDIESFVYMLDDMGGFYRNIILGRAIETNILVDSVDKNFRRSFLDNIASFQDSDEVSKLGDENFLCDLLNKKPSNKILNLLIRNERRETGNQTIGVTPEIYFVGYQVPIEGVSYEVNIYGNITFAYKDTVMVELLYCEKMDEAGKENISKMEGLLQRFTYNPERILELLHITNGLDAMIKIRNKRQRK